LFSSKHMAFSHDLNLFFIITNYSRQSELSPGVNLGDYLPRVQRVR
jgi:hypothetical protein